MQKHITRIYYLSPPSKMLRWLHLKYPYMANNYTERKKKRNISKM